MNPGVLIGIGSVVMAGLLQGIFAVPLKLVRRWNYENVWLVFCLTGFVAFPWLLALATIPHLHSVYAATPKHVLLRIVYFGLCWGVGATLTGVGLTMLGIGLGFAIILGVSASVGSLIPLLILNPSAIHTSAGHAYLLGTAVMLLGIALCACAGMKRDTATQEASNSKMKFVVGLLVCCGSGLLSSALNFAYALSDEVVVHARHFGAKEIWAPVAVTAIATIAGCLPNVLYCGYLMRTNRSASNFLVRGATVNWFWGAAMGLAWFGGQALYGFGIWQMGALGTVIGWPVLMGMLILASNGAALATGEWKSAPASATRFLTAGMLTIGAALGVLAVGQAAH